MSSPHGSLFCSHWKCAAVVCEVNRIERFRCCWKNPAVEIIKVDAVEWSSVSFFPPLYSCHFLSLSAILLSSFHLCFPFFFFFTSFILLSHILPSCFFSVFVFCLIASLDRHVQSHHGHHKPFKCKLCPFKSAYVSRLKSHLHKAHTGKHTHTHTLRHSHTR